MYSSVLPCFVALVASAILLPRPVRAFPSANTDTKKCFSGDSSKASATNDLLGLDVSRLRQTIASGRVYQQHDFFSEKEVEALLSEVDSLRASGALMPSGLSNTNKGKRQNFGKADRELCPVPWWNDSLSDDRRLLQVDDPIVAIHMKLQALRVSLSSLLDRKTMSEECLAHECYYSRSTEGSFLDRHMDERHEETKGSRGWLLPSRRSISWLVYLSDPGWDSDVNGGQLRSFPQAKFDGVPGKIEAGSHNGNLQVGWLVRKQGDSTTPVYLDSWYKVRNQKTGTVEPHCILYVIANSEDVGAKYITQPWVNDLIQGGTAADFIKSRADIEKESLRKCTEREKESCLFTHQEFARDFCLLEDRESWASGKPPYGSVAEDIVPSRGSLVMFDSVSVPHEVMLVSAGTRTALAGWFHEETQPFPQNF